MLSCVRAVPRVLVCGACQRAQSTAPTVRAREELAAEGNLPSAERGEGTADAPQAAGLNAARHFPQIRRHGKRGKELRVWSLELEEQVPHEPCVVE